MVTPRLVLLYCTTLLVAFGFSPGPEGGLLYVGLPGRFFFDDPWGFLPVLSLLSDDGHDGPAHSFLAFRLCLNFSNIGMA